MNWSGNFREGLAREIRENKTLAKITAYTVWGTTQSALQCIITPGHWIQYQSCTHSAPSQLPGEHSGQAPLQERTHATSSKQQITFASCRVPIYTPGWRAAMWIKCLAEGQKVPGIDRNRARNPLIQSQGFNPIHHGTSTSTKNVMGSLTCKGCVET